MAQHNCPACDAEMPSGRMGPARVDICVPCGGTWLEEGALPALAQGGPQVLKTLCEKVQALRKPVAGHTTHSPRCPSCRVPLVVTGFASMPGIQLHTCSFCRGFWLDQGALSGLLARFTPAPKPDARPPAPAPARPAPMAAGPQAYGPPAAAPPQFTPPPASIWAGPASAVTGRPASKTAPVGGRTADVTVCPDCQETNPKGTPICWACGKVLQARVVGTCPRCSGSMHDVETEGIHITACQGCGGTLLDDPRLTRLLGLPEHNQKRLLEGIKRLRSGKKGKHHATVCCPHCSKTAMVDAPLGMMAQEPVHVCPGCQAIFLDDGVLDRVLWSR